MIDLSSNKKLYINKKKLASEINKRGYIYHKIVEWDLTQLKTILTVDSLEDDQKRKEIIHKSKLKSNIITGAIMGGMLDASSGEDSIVDGILLGAGFGLIATGSQEAPKAQIGLLFNDGSHLSVEVDKSEYTRLQTFCKSNEANAISSSGATVFTERHLNPGEINFILEQRISSQLIVWGIMAMMLMIAPIFLGPIFIAELKSPNEYLAIAIDYIPILGFGFLMISIFISYYRYSNLGHQVINNREKIFYDSLKLNS